MSSNNKHNQYTNGCASFGSNGWTINQPTRSAHRSNAWGCIPVAIVIVTVASYLVYLGM
jgi:hypothetical protein